MVSPSAFLLVVSHWFLYLPNACVLNFSWSQRLVIYIFIFVLPFLGSWKPGCQNMKLFATYKRISKRSGRALWGVAKRTKHIASIAMVALLQHKHAPNWAFHSEQDSYSCANSCLDAENNVSDRERGKQSSIKNSNYYYGGKIVVNAWVQFLLLNQY